MENKAHNGFCDNIVIHSYPNTRYIAKASASFRQGEKIVYRIVMRDVDAVLAYMARQPFCTDIPYRIINHI
jgi:hypothetical protein